MTVLEAGNAARTGRLQRAPQRTLLDGRTPDRGAAPRLLDAVAAAPGLARGQRSTRSATVATELFGDESLTRVRDARTGSVQALADLGRRSAATPMQSRQAGKLTHSV